MARRDADGYIRLVDRKSKKIISGSENIYPSEAEGVIGAFSKRSRAISFFADAEMPRTDNGKIVHRTLRERIVTAATS